MHRIPSLMRFVGAGEATPWVVSSLLLFALAWGSAAAAAPAARSAKRTSAAAADPYLWLENVTGRRALAWVTAQNAVATAAVTASPTFASTQSRMLDILNSTTRIPYVTKIGDFYYNLWLDKDHPRGLWRRTTLDEYRKEQPAWETVLDVDALGKAEGESWVWKGVQPLVPTYDRCLISLSRGGADATVVREFDLAAKQFVADGFTLPENKSDVGWVDRDHIYIGTDFGAGSLTTSGYPRVAKVWTRGTRLADATVAFEGEATDVAAGVYRDPTPGFVRDIALRYPTMFSNQTFLRRDGQWLKVDKPDDADVGFDREWLYITLRSDWTLDGTTYAGGSLLITRADDFLAGRRAFAVLFAPTATTSLQSVAPTQGALLVNTMDNVKNRVVVWTFVEGRWQASAVPGLPRVGSIEVSPVDPLASDDFFVTSTDFLTPTTLSLATVGGGEPQRLKQGPAYFDASPLSTEQHFATSKDGTVVPYFEVKPRDLPLDGTAPTMLEGYGGFEVSQQPYYSGLNGAGWLERGGVYVLANIRGGGEFGPRWHQAALKQNRHRAYEDFAAVAEDLIARKVTSPAHLGCIGGSNGGLLVGNMLVRRPELFGAIVCEQPLLDMKRYSHLLAGASWMGEYGDPDKPDEWAYIKTFSPYHLVSRSATYPPTLFTSSTRDDRVHPGHARKTAAKLQAQGHRDILFYENVEGGHAGAADHTQAAFMQAMAYEFLWHHLAAKPASAQ